MSVDVVDNIKVFADKGGFGDGDASDFSAREIPSNSLIALNFKAINDAIGATKEEKRAEECGVVGDISVHVFGFLDTRAKHLGEVGIRYVNRWNIINIRPGAELRIKWES